MGKKQQFIWRYTILMFGLMAMGLGISLTIRGNLGVNPWTVFHIGISNLSGLSVGRITQLVGVVLLGLGSLLLKQRPGIGTIINMVVVGWSLDLFLYTFVVPEATHMLVRILYVVSGIVIIGITTAMYISMRLGAGPRDGIMLGFARLGNWKVGKVRASMEATVLVVGFFLGGPVGLGTVLAIGIGPVVQWSLGWLEPLWEA